MTKRQDDISSCNENRNGNESLQNNDHSILDGILKDEIQQKKEEKKNIVVYYSCVRIGRPCA